jgi:hypothetical protein
MDDNATNKPSTVSTIRNPAKLNDTLIQRICQLFRDVPGVAISTVCDSLRISRDVFYDWMTSGKNDPDQSSICARFYREVVAAKADGEITLIEEVRKVSPQFILSRRFPRNWPSERQLIELSGPGGAALEPPKLNIIVQSGVGQPTEMPAATDHPPLTKERQARLAQVEAQIADAQEKMETSEPKHDAKPVSGAPGRLNQILKRPHSLLPSNHSK